MNHRWIRVNRKHRCQICAHGDWCTVCPELNLILCMRIESSRPSKNSMGGWLHKIDETFTPIRSFTPPTKAIEDKPVDLTGMWKRWFEQTDHYHLDGFAMSLGVDTDSLHAIGCAWAEKAWAFPMRDGQGNIIGIRLRNEEGRKWSVTGSRSGLFFAPVDAQKTLWVTEGPTDAAAALTLGLCAIGRPSCQGQEAMISDYIRKQGISRVIVIADNDEPGLRGSAKLQSELPVRNCVWSPPAKDLREFLNLGGTRAMVESSIKDIVWTNPVARAA